MADLKGEIFAGAVAVAVTVAVAVAVVIEVLFLIFCMSDCLAELRRRWLRALTGDNEEDWPGWDGIFSELFMWHWQCFSLAY